jgi:hypothetical protein
MGAGGVPTLLTNIRSGLKGLPEKQTLAYLLAALVKKKNVCFLDIDIRARWHLNILQE